MEPQATFDAAELVSLLTEQRDLCVRLLSLAEHQRSLIIDDKPERLLEVLADRQRLFDRYTGLSKRLQPYQQRWREIRPRLSTEKAWLVEQLLSEVNTRLSAVLANDQEDAELLLARKNSASEISVPMKADKQAAAAYTTDPDSGCSNMDWTDG